MFVRALRSIASPHGTALAGETLEVPPEIARDWIGLGLVEPVGPPIEESTRSAPEYAVRRKGKR